MWYLLLGGVIGALAAIAVIIWEHRRDRTDHRQIDADWVRERERKRLQRMKERR